jgi:CRP-like cAMP-binding protein
MISPERLRRFTFFGFMDDAQLKAVAMITEEISFGADETILEAGKIADTFYILTEGGASYYCVVKDSNYQGVNDEYFISDINPGELFGISALIEPYLYTATIRASQPTRAIRIDAASLRALCDQDPRLAYGMMRETARVAIERLNDTHTLLAAARV